MGFLEIPIYPIPRDRDYGPDAVAFLSLVERTRRLTVGEVDLLAARYRGFYPHSAQTFPLDIREPAYSIARRIAPLMLPQAARLAIMDAAAATVLRDAMEPDAYRWATFPWRDAVESGAGQARDPRPAGDFTDWEETLSVEGKAEAERKRLEAGDAEAAVNAARAQSNEAGLRRLAAAVWGGVSGADAQAEVEAWEQREERAREARLLAELTWRSRLRAAWKARWPFEDWEANDAEPYGDRGWDVRHATSRLDGRETLQALEDMPEGVDPAPYLEGLASERHQGLRELGIRVNPIHGSEPGPPEEWDKVRLRPVDRDRLIRRLNLAPATLRAQRARYEAALGRLVARKAGRPSRRRTLLEARYSALVVLMRRRATVERDMSP